MPGHPEIDECLVDLFARSLANEVLAHQQQAGRQISGIRLEPIELRDARVLGGNSFDQGIQIANSPLGGRDDCEID